MFVINNQFCGYTLLWDIGLKSLIFFSDFFFSFLFSVSYLLGLLIHYSLTTDVNILGKNRVPAVRT